MPHTLLLADDSLTIRRLVELTFADEGIEVVAVADGRRAIERIAAAPPDIVLADAGMSRPDGYDVAAFVKGRPELSRIPVILLTAAFHPIDEARAAKVGCDAVLAKPFELTQLVSRVKELLEAALSAIPAAAAAEAPVIPALEALSGSAAAPVASEPSPGRDEAGTAEPRGDEPAEAASLDERIDRVDASLAAGATAASPADGPGVARPEGPGEARAETWSGENDGDGLSLDDYFDQVEAAARGEAAAVAALRRPSGDDGEGAPRLRGNGNDPGAADGASPGNAEELAEATAEDPVTRVFLALLRGSDTTPSDGDFERIIRALRGEGSK